MHELVFYYNDEVLVITKDCSFLIIAQEEENDKIVYKISSYQEWFDEEEKPINNTEAIKNKLFCGDDKTLKNVTILPITYQDRNREDEVLHFLHNVTSSYNCIQKYIS